MICKSCKKEMYGEYVSGYEEYGRGRPIKNHTGKHWCENEECENEGMLRMTQPYDLIEENEC